MAFDFPANPTPGTAYRPAGGPSYVWDGTTWAIEAGVVSSVTTAETRSRIVNGAMQHSQENGNTAGTTNTYFPADQWPLFMFSGGAVSYQRVQVVTPNGSKDRLRLTVTTPLASLAAGSWLAMYQNIEGIRVADFRYGLASAKQSILRFGFKAPAGVYSATIRNSAATRCYVANFTISAGQANTDTEQVLVIPGDITGAWLTDTGIGMLLTITVAAGSTYIGVSGWQAAANAFATASNTNGWATNGNTFELFDVSLHLDPQNTGIAPPWTMPDEAQELAACMRYWQKLTGYIAGYGTAPGFQGRLSTAITPMRVAGALAFSGVTNSNCTGPTNYGTSPFILSANVVSAAAGNFVSDSFISLNARM